MNHPVVANEYSLVAPEVGERSADFYFSSQKLPIVKLVTKCNKKGENCWQEAVNQDGQRLRGYSQKDSVSLIASGRYKNRAAAIIRRTPEGCSDCTETKLITHRGQTSDFIVPEHVGNALSVIMTAKKNLAILTPAGVEIINRKGKTVSTLEAPAVLHHGVLRNNPAGTVAALAITDTHELVLSNLSGWVESGVILSENGDRKGVLGIYPENKLCDFRAGVEGNISCLKRRYGLSRCTWRGLKRFKAYIWSSTVAYNLMLLARLETAT